MTYVVGFSAHRDDHAAIDLACQLARSDRDRVRVVTVVPPGWPTALAWNADREFEQWAATEGESCAAEARELLAVHADVPSEAVWLSGKSVPATLIADAEREGASLIVVGSGDESRWGEVAMTSKTSRLLHSSPMAIAVAPRGYRSGRTAVIRRATVAFRGDEQTHDLLDRASEICTRVGAALRIVTFAVRGRTMYPPEVSGAEDMVLQQWRVQAEQQQADAAASLIEAGFPAEKLSKVVAVGSTWDRAIDSLDWGTDEVLVVGSSPSQPMAQVFLGSSATKILRHSPVPVIVVP